MLLKLLKLLCPFVLARDYEIMVRRALKAEERLDYCYQCYPTLHYHFCSEYARDHLFRRNHWGEIEYVDPNVRTVEPPF